MADRVAITLQLDPELLSDARRLAQTEGRGIDAIIEEALLKLFEKRRRQPRAHVMAAFEKSIDQFGEVYKRLAK